MPAEVYFLNLQVKGQCRMSQGGRSALIHPGQFSIVDSTEPYLNDYCCDDWLQYSFRIPRHLLRPQLRNADHTTATSVSANGGVGTVAVEFLMSIARNAHNLSPGAAQLSHSMIELVAMSLGATDSTVEAGERSTRKALCTSVTNYIERNIADPNLSPAKAAAHFGISLRYLHRVLEEGNRSFGRIVLEERLAHCAQDLTSARKESISEVAMRWGFNDLSHFSRTFRQRFGKTPREFRQTEVRASLLR